MITYLIFDPCLKSFSMFQSFADLNKKNYNNIFFLSFSKSVKNIEVFFFIIKNYK